jgi:uncharacterized protein (TIGR02452 family)
MKKTTRALKAKETLEIIERGAYEAAGRTIEVREQISGSLAGTVLYRSDEFDPVLRSAAEKLTVLNEACRIRVENCTVLEGAAELVASGQRVGCLNFASARNPGGGFLGGAQAQEESLAVSSALYPTLMEKFEQYAYNRSRNTYLYSDHMIWSPDVVFFRDDYGELLAQPYVLSVITSPATNIGAIRTNKPEEMEAVEETMMRRMDKMLAVFVHHGIQHLLLGAWGCGVFQNDPGDIARYFAHYLKGDGKYARCFKEVLFAVYDRSKGGENINAFMQQLGEGQEAVSNSNY